MRWMLSFAIAGLAGILPICAQTIALTGATIIDGNGGTLFPKESW